jgi:hypothetical protein
MAFFVSILIEFLGDNSSNNSFLELMFPKAIFTEDKKSFLP